MDHEEEIQSMGKLEECSSSIPVEEIMEEVDNSNSNTVGVIPLEGHLDTAGSRWEKESVTGPELQEGFLGRRREFQDGRDFESCTDQWIPNKEDTSWKKSNTQWMDYGIYNFAGMGRESEGNVTILEEYDLQFPTANKEKHSPISSSDSMEDYSEEEIYEWDTLEESYHFKTLDDAWTYSEFNYPIETEKNWKVSCTLRGDYEDDGYPYWDFLMMYPETYGSSAGELWEELLGYTVGRIGFMALLNGSGTLGYLLNEDIWPGRWWIMPAERVGLYFGTVAGIQFVKDQILWESVRNRKQEEEDFLAGVVSKMVTYFGRVGWEEFCWVIREEQKQLGKDYLTFWKDWEYSAFLEY